MVLGNTALYRSAITNRPNTASIDENGSIFIDSLELIKENNRFFNETFKRIHTNLLMTESENRNSVYITEFSFKEMISNIIEFFIEAIKTAWGKFKSIVQKIVGSDSTIDKYASRLKSMKHDFTVSFPRYIYTCFDEDTPSIDLKTTFDDDYSVLERRIADIADLKTKAERCERFRVLESEAKADVSPAYYDTLRQKTINVNHMVSSHDFPSELFNIFRDGGKQTTSKITPDEVTNTVNRYQAHKGLIKKLEKAKTETISSAKEIQRKMELISLKNVNRHYVPYDVEEEALFTKILQTKSGQVSEACNIFVMAFSAKLDAVKESAIQDKKVLFEAIRFINIGGDN